MEFIESFTCLANLYEDVRESGKDAFWLSPMDFFHLRSRTSTQLMMIDGKLTALHGLDYDGEYVQHLIDGRLVTFRPAIEKKDGQD